MGRPGCAPPPLQKEMHSERRTWTMVHPNQLKQQDVGRSCPPIHSTRGGDESLVEHSSTNTGTNSTVVVTRLKPCTPGVER
jgi:hypothetical protein